MQICITPAGIGLSMESVHQVSLHHPFAISLYKDTQCSWWKCYIVNAHDTIMMMMMMIDIEYDYDDDVVMM